MIEAELTINIPLLDSEKHLQAGIINRVGKKIIPTLKRVTPVRTGKLKAGWESIIVDTTVLITNDVPYAGYVENGTRYFQGRGMIRQLKSRFQDILIEETEKAYATL